MSPGSSSPCTGGFPLPAFQDSQRFRTISVAGAHAKIIFGRERRSLSHHAVSWNQLLIDSLQSLRARNFSSKDSPGSVGGAGTRLDQWLVSQLPDVSRVRIQQLIEQKKILVNGKCPSLP